MEEYFTEEISLKQSFLKDPQSKEKIATKVHSGKEIVAYGRTWHVVGRVAVLYHSRAKIGCMRGRN